MPESNDHEIQPIRVWRRGAQDGFGLPANSSAAAAVVGVECAAGPQCVSITMRSRIPRSQEFSVAAKAPPGRSQKIPSALAKAPPEVSQRPPWVRSSAGHCSSYRLSPLDSARTAIWPSEVSDASECSDRSFGSILT